MTLELFADNPVVVGQSWSTLSAPYTAGASSLAVVSNTPYPAADPTANPATVFRVRVDNEILLVTDNRTLTWTVAGAQEGSTAANHASGVQVFVPFTKGSVAGVLAAASADATAKVAAETTRATTAEAAKAAAVHTHAEADVTSLTADLAAKAAKAANLSDLTDAVAARTNLGLGSAATHPSTDFDAAGAAAAAQAAAIATAATDATTKANAAQAAAIAASQPLDSDLTAIAALTTTSFGRALLALADAAAGRTAFGLGTAATQASSAFDAAGLAAAAQAASQPVDSDLTAIAALTTTAYGRAFLALADAAAARTALALGTIATHDATEFLTTASAASTYAPLASPALTGTPTVPTAALGTNTTQAASTAFSAAAIAAQHTTDLGFYVPRRGGSAAAAASLWSWNVRDYGALGDGRRVTDATITSGQATVTSATAAFTAGDVGKQVVFDGAGAAGAPLATTVATFISATQITLTANASTTVASAGNLFWATDDTASFTAAITAATATGGIIWTPPGLYGITGNLVVPGGVTLEGVGIDYATASWYPLRGSVLVCCTSGLGAVITLGSDATSTSSGQTGAKIRGLIVDGAQLAANVVKTFARRARVERCQVYSGTSVGLWVAGQNGYFDRTIVGMRAAGICYSVTNNDNKLISCEGRQGATVIQIQASGTMINGGHYYCGTGAGNPASGNDVVINPTSGNAVNDTVISGVTWDACQGHHILVQPATTATVTALSITGCVFYQNGTFTDNSGAMVRIDPAAASSRISAVTIVANAAFGIDATHRMTSLCSVNSGSGTSDSVNVIGNVGRFLVAVTSGSGAVDGSKHGNVIQNGTTVLYSTKAGTATKSGDGATTAFTIAHGLSTTPTEFGVVAGSATAAAPFYVTADGTNLTVTYVTAPASGASNLTLTWRAQI